MKVRTMILSFILALLPPLALSAQTSPPNNHIYSPAVMTATAQTSAPVTLGLSSALTSWTGGALTITGSGLTTATIAVQGSSDNGVTYYTLPIYSVTSPGTNTTTVTVTGTTAYQLNLAGLTHIRFVTSGTFTATNISIVLTASPNGMVARSAAGSTGLNQLTGDVAAGPGTGSQAATVQGLQGVPFCSGFTPTNGQAVQYTTAGSPNPCYTAAAVKVGSAQVVYVSQSCTGTTIDPTIGLTAVGGTGTDFASCINGLMTTAAGAPLEIVLDESVLTTNIHIPVAGNVTLTGLGAGLSSTPITNCSVTSNVATLTALNTLKAGQNLLFAGLSTCTFMNVANGESAPYFTVLSAGLSATQFEVAVSHANVSGAEAGWATFMYGTWLFAAPGANNSVITVLANGTAIPSDPATVPPARGANVSVTNLGVNGNRGNGTDGNSTSGDPRGVGATWYMDFQLWNTEDALIDNVFFYNAPTYALLLNNAGHVKVTNSRADAFLPGQTSAATNQDGFHVNGAANDIYFANDAFKTGDDAIALNAVEGYCGPITRVTAVNITLHLAQQGGRAYTNSANCLYGVAPIISNVTFDNWTGDVVTTPFMFGSQVSHAEPIVNSIDNFTWTNSRIAAARGFGIADSVGNLTIDNVKLVGISTAMGFINPVGTASTISTLTLNNDACVRNASGSTCVGAVNGATTVFAAGSGAFGNVNVRGFRIEDQGVSPGNTSALLVLNGATASTITNLHYDSDYTQNISALALGGTITNTFCLGCAPGISWATPTAGIATSQATFPGGDLFFGGVNAQTGTTYAVVAADENKRITLNNAAAVAVSIAAATTAGFTAGAEFSFINLGAGAVTITPTTSTINGASSLVLATGQSVRLTSDGTNYAAELGAGASGITGTPPIVVTANNVACPSCSTGTGSNVEINGGAALGTANFNGATPAAPAGKANVTFQVSGANASAYVSNPGSLILLEEHTAAASTIAFNTRNVTGQSGATFQSDFDVYQVTCVNVVPTSNGTQIFGQVSSNGGVSYDTTSGHYNYNNIRTSSANSTTTQGSNSVAFWVLASPESAISNNASFGWNTTFQLYDPLNASHLHSVGGNGNYYDTGSNQVFYSFSSSYSQTTAYNAFIIIPGVGTTLASGTCRLYGMAK